MLIKKPATPPELGPGVLALGDTQVKPEEQEVIAPMPVDAKAQLAKLGFPEEEGDVAPAAMIPKACNSIHTHLSKLDAVLSGYQSQSLSGLQIRNLTLIMKLYLGGVQDSSNVSRCFDLDVLIGMFSGFTFDMLAPWGF